MNTTGNSVRTELNFWHSSAPLGGCSAGQPAAEMELILCPTVMLNTTGFELPSVPEPIAGLAGRIRVSKQNVELDKLEGRLGKTRFDVNGVLAISEKVQFQSLTVHTKLNVEQWLRLDPGGAHEDAWNRVGMYYRFDWREEPGIDFTNTNLDVLVMSASPCTVGAFV